MDRSTAGRIGGCVAVGYPKHAARPEAPFTTGEVDGWIPAGSGLKDTAEGRQEGFLTLKAEGTPPRPLPTNETKLTGSVWEGMSGAAVLAGGVLVGVVAEHHLPEGDGSLTVVPIAWAERLDGAGRGWLLQALGVESAAGMELVTAGAPSSAVGQCAAGPADGAGAAARDAGRAAAGAAGRGGQAGAAGGDGRVGQVGAGRPAGPGRAGRRRCASSLPPIRPGWRG